MSDGQGGVLVEDRDTAKIDPEAVQNPKLAAIVASIRAGTSRAGRSFNNFVN